MNFLLLFGGFDPSSFAGISADIMTSFSQGVHPLAVITANTVQVSGCCKKTASADISFAAEQFDLLMEKYKPVVIKSGMLADIEMAKLLYQKVTQYSLKLVLDPVVRASAGKKLVSEETFVFMREYLIPQAYLITPNIPESLKLLGSVKTAQAKLAEQLFERFKVPVFLKGGHQDRDDNMITDILIWSKGQKNYQREKVSEVDSHGSGCRLAAAIAANISKGFLLEDACERSFDWIGKSFQNPYQTSEGPILSFGGNYL